MNAERIASDELPAALEGAQRRPGWNFRDVPIRTAAVGGCIVIVVPAKVWAHRRRERQAAEFAGWQAGQAPCG